MNSGLTLLQILERTFHFALPFTIALSLIFIFKRAATKFGFVDRPDQRKSHEGNIPLVGGPAIFFAIAFSCALLVPQFQVLIFLLLSGFMVLLGVVDDRVDLPASFRLVAQAAIAATMVVYASVAITSVGNLTGSGPLLLHGSISLIFTIVCTIGAINAVNMIDGVDGLTGTIMTISFSAIGWVAWQDGDWVTAKLISIFVGAIAAFLIFNARIFVPRAKIFMGDSGSMLMGLILVWFLIRVTQGSEPSMSPVVAGWVLGLPLLDTISVMVGRLRSGRHIFEAGRDHFHHRLLDSGLSVNQTVLAAGAFHATFVCIGVKVNEYRELEPILFWAFVATVVIHHFATPIVLNWLSLKLNNAPSLETD